MQRWRAIAVAVALAMSGAVVTLTASVAGADTAPVVGGSWYWREQVPRNVPNPVSPLGTPGSVPRPPDVPEHDFPVAVKAGDPGSGTDVSDDKQTFIHIDTTVIPTDSTISKFVLTLKEDTAAQQLNAPTASIKAYPVTGFFVPGGEALAWDDRPDFDRTSAEAPGTRASNGTWTFDLTSIVQKWVSGSLANNGLAFAAAGIQPGSQPFEVVWSGTNPTPSTTGTFTPPAGTGADTSNETTGTSFDATSSPISISPDLSTPFIAPETALVPAPSPAVDTTSATPRIRQIVRSRAKHGITIGFIGAALAVIALVGAGMFALGEAGEPVAARRGSVMRALERRLQQPA